MKVPTGDIIIVQGEHGPLETVSIGDYGKARNVKASFLGLDRDIEEVEDGGVLPLTEKWVITVSTQYGCAMNCKFCDVPKVPRKGNATLKDLKQQVSDALKLNPEIIYTKRLNLHYARMGEPSFNDNVLKHAEGLYRTVEISYGTLHPVVSTMLPKGNRGLGSFLQVWCQIKNVVFSGEAGLQFSINSTNDCQRDHMFSGNSLSLKSISDIGTMLPLPNGRKYALNFALAAGCEVDAKKLYKLFSPDKFMVKITPIHETKAVHDNRIESARPTKYITIEENLKREGFDVLIFFPSKEEDSSRITCGNLLLAEGL